MGGRSAARTGALVLVVLASGMRTLAADDARSSGAALAPLQPLAMSDAAHPKVPPPPPPPAPPYPTSSATSSAAMPVPATPSVSRDAEYASGLARRLGMTYEDGGAYVLLSDGFCRVRLYPGSHVISLDGAEMTLRGLPQREMGGVRVPGPAAGIIEQHVLSSRAQRAAPAPQPPTPAPATVAMRPPLAAPQALTPKPAVPAVAPSLVMPDPQWVVAPTARAWKWIVLHHSDDTSGCVAKYNQVHLDKGWENGCGYHFVVGNGSQSGDGQVEVSNRWRLQQQGAHAKTPDNLFNEHGIGICLVGDFEHGGRPTAAQMRGLVRLVQWLMDRYDIPSVNVRGHCDCKSTCCPGRFFPWAELRSRLREPGRSLAVTFPAKKPLAATQPVAMLPGAQPASGARSPVAPPMAVLPASNVGPSGPTTAVPPTAVPPTAIATTPVAPVLGPPPSGPLPEPAPVGR